MTSAAEIISMNDGADRHSLKRPRALRPGDHVAVLSVSSPADQSLLQIGLDALRFSGLLPIVYPSALDTGSWREYLAGDDALRAADLRQALLDPTIAGVIFATGGSGAGRTLEAMNWSGISEVQPKVVAGYSDVTAILEAVAVKLGWASLLSPMVVTDGQAQHYSFTSFIRVLMQPERAQLLHFEDAQTVNPGIARGITIGGNLCLLTTTQGTDTSKPARGGILLMEDIDEPDFKIDRMLTQLRRSGYFDGVAGIITGTFDRCASREIVQAILEERLADLGVPMITWANIGHGGRFQTFPVGVAAELDAGARTLRFLEPPLIPVGD